MFQTCHIPLANTAPGSDFCVSHIQNAYSLAIVQAEKKSKKFPEGGWDTLIKLEDPRDAKSVTSDGCYGPPDSEKCYTIKKLLELKKDPVVIAFYCNGGNIRSPSAAAWYANEFVLPKGEKPNTHGNQIVAVVNGGYTSLPSVSEGRADSWQRPR